ncbi:hypothetical protein TorRG33x02_000820 [Trema orientale]|uniref:Uncharacterized protein n=1 Tax=Trema orientale TaxID=63057 RepID=A0A2P5G140_TREOI|nr:hypothetical protein TorRG33x02_000820 [Trema orientale]
MKNQNTGSTKTQKRVCIILVSLIKLTCSFSSSKCHHSESNLASLPSDHRTSSLIGHNLEQQRVWHSAINDTRRPNTLRKRPDAAIHLRNHSATDFPLLHHLLHPFYVNLLHQATRVVSVSEDSSHVRQQNQLLGPQCRRQFSGHRIGIDVVLLAELVRGHRSNHRNVAVIDDRPEYGRVDPRHLPDEAQFGGVCGGPGRHNPAVGAAEPDGLDPGLVDERDEVLVYLTGQDHGDNLHGLGVRDSEAVVEADLDVEAFEPEVDLGPTAVDEDGAEAHAGEEDEVVDDGGLEGLRLHGGAAVLDHDGFAPEFLDEGERFRENVDSELTRGGGG